MKTKENIFIHPNSIVETNNIGEATRIWEFSHVQKNVSIGKNCNIGAHCYIEEGVKIGNRVTIKNGVSIWNGVMICDDVFVGPNCVFTNDRFPRSKIRKPIVPTLIKNGSTIGANATIICGNILGEYCMIGAGSVVTKNIPDFGLVIGNPAKLIGSVDHNGNRINEKNCDH